MSCLMASRDDVAKEFSSLGDVVVVVVAVLELSKDESILCLFSL